MPLRRSLKTFDHHNPADYSLDSMVGVIRGLGQSLIDSPATFDPDSYLRQMRSDRAKSVGRELTIQRETAAATATGRESSVARMSSITEQDSKTPSPLTSRRSVTPSVNNIQANGNGMIVRNEGSNNGHATTSESQAQTLPPGDNGKLSVQDKMNNYSQYYQNLTSSSPLTRFQLTPSQIQAEGGRGTTPGMGNGLNNSVKSDPGNSSAIGLARLRPNTMYETSFNNGETSQRNGNHFVKEQTPDVTQNSPKTAVASTTSIPKWPGVSVQQYRPLSISSFPSTEHQLNQRASSVSRVVSPPPTPQPQGPTQNQLLTNGDTGTKKKEPSRATSVERITRFLERKSVPRESQDSGSRPLSPAPVSRPQSPNQFPTQPATPIPTPVTPKSGRSKFLQSLEKKWEKFTTPKESGVESQEKADTLKNTSRPISPPPVPPSGHRSPLTIQPEKEGSPEELSPDDNKISESVLLRRALSPEKKLTKEKKFGSGTVNFMLGKFKRFEEVTPPPAANKFQIQPTTKPPPGGSRIGRRVQSAYVGAASDSVLSLPQGQLSRPEAPMPSFVRPTSPVSPPTPVLQQPPTSAPTAPSLSTSETLSPNNLPDLGIIRSAEAAQQKRRSLRLDTRSPSPGPPPSTPSAETNPIPKPNSAPQYRPIMSTGTTNSGPISTTTSNTPGSGTSNVGLFTPDQKSSPAATSLIPRSNPGLATLRCTSPLSINTAGELSPLPKPPQPELITSKSMSPPKITVHSGDFVDSSLLSPSMLSPNSIASISDSAELDLDSSSVCSDTRNPDARNHSSASVLDEEESVSDRILRKSFYSRFNSIDRAKRSASLNAAGAARKGIYPLNASNGNAGRNSGGNLTNHNHHHHSHHHHHRSSVAKSPTPLETTPTPSHLHKSFSPTPSEPCRSNGSITPVPVSNCTLSDKLSPPTDNLTREPSPHSLVINKYNPNPLFKELITEDFKSDIEKKTEYSRRVTSKLSKLLREIETDLNTCSLTKKDDLDDEDCDNNENDGLHLSNGHHSVIHNNHNENDRKPSPSKPPIGIGLKALTSPGSSGNNGTGANQNIRKYGGSKTTNLGGSINALSTNSVLTKRNLFNRESSLQPDVKPEDGKGALLKQRATSVTRTVASQNDNMDR